MDTTNLDLTTQAGVLALLEQARSSEDWGRGCDLVKLANGGYPVFWWPVVIQSGFMDRITECWGSSSAITVFDLKTDEEIATTGPQGREEA